MIDIPEKEEEDDSTLRNESLIHQKKKKKNDNFNKSIFVNNDNSKNINNNSTNNVNQNELIKKENRININTNENKKENKKLFNNYLGFNPMNVIKKRNILNTINSIGSHNTDIKLNNYKASFNIFSNPKKISPYKSAKRRIRYDKLNSKEDNMRNKILKENINENNHKIFLPSLKICNKSDKRNLSSNKKYNRISINKLPQRNISHCPIRKSSNSFHLNNGLKYSIENLDKYKIDLFSEISKSSNILIPLISSKHNINYLEYENNKNEEQKNNKYNEMKNNNENDNNIEDNKKRNNYSNNKLFLSIKKNIILDNNNYNLLLNFDKSFITKLHKIKIEKGMIGDKIFENINKNIFNNEYNGLVTFENNILNSKLPLINQQNNRNIITKNRINRKIKIKLK